MSGVNLAADVCIPSVTCLGCLRLQHTGLNRVVGFTMKVVRAGEKRGSLWSRRLERGDNEKRTLCGG